MKNHTFRQRVGQLIEDYVCEKYNFQYNKRQRTRGYYDAYDVNYIYEIKSTYIHSNRFVIKIDNHKQLLRYGGSYIFITYDLIDHDKELSVVSDIDIKDEKFINAKQVDGLLNNKQIEKFSKNNKNKYQRIRTNEVF